MSKASEWANTLTKYLLTRPSFLPYVTTTDDGCPCLFRETVPEKDIQKFLAWLQEWFGEEPAQKVLGHESEEIYCCIRIKDNARLYLCKHCCSLIVDNDMNNPCPGRQQNIAR